MTAQGLLKLGLVATKRNLRSTTELAKPTPLRRPSSCLGNQICFSILTKCTYNPSDQQFATRVAAQGSGSDTDRILVYFKATRSDPDFTMGVTGPNQDSCDIVTRIPFHLKSTCDELHNQQYISTID